SRAVGRTGGHAAQCGPDRAGEPAQFAPGKGMGRVHRRGHSCAGPEARSDDLRPLGLVRAEEGPAHRRQAPYDHQVAAPLAASGEERVLREPTFLENQRNPPQEWFPGNRLADPRPARVTSGVILSGTALLSGSLPWTDSFAP